jgi:hypothetical protein
MTPHTCFKDINEKLKQYNTRLAVNIDVSGQNRELIQVATVKADIDVRKKPSTMFASHCQFCGVKLKGST